MYDYDWFRGPGFREQIEQAKFRCAIKKFPNLDEHDELPDDALQFLDELQARILVYLRDGFSYELKELVELDSKAHLTFECEPVEEQYKVGAFVVSVPFEDVVRIEVFAVHPSEKPEDTPTITGFRHAPEAQVAPTREESRPRKVSVSTEETG